MILAAVFLLSLSSLTFEVLLARIFSISQWNHLSFMVISIALFGFGAAGTSLSLIATRTAEWEIKLTRVSAIKAIVILYAAFSIGSFALLDRLPLDYFRLPVEAIQLVYLFAAYVLLAMPFFFAGSVISLAYARLPKATGRIYLCSMLGSAAGATIPFFLLPVLGEGKLLMIAAAVPLCLVIYKNPKNTSSGANRFRKRIPRIKYYLTAGIGMVLLLGLLNSQFASSLLDIKPSPYKALSHVLQFPSSRIVKTETGIRGRIDYVQSPHLHYAPGLSLKYTSLLPEQSAIYKDGDDPLILYAALSDQKLGFAKYTLSYAGYNLRPHAAKALIIQNGGGLAIPCAKSAGIGHFAVIEEDPRVALAIERHYRTPVIARHPRDYLAQSKERFDIIHVENWGSSFPEAAVLSQDNLFTIDAFTAYLNHLNKTGILILTRRLHLPPSDLLRLWGTANEALRRKDISLPKDHIRILRNWDAFTLIVALSPIRDDKPLVQFAEEMNFDWVYSQRIEGKKINHYSVFDSPYYHKDAMALSESYRSGGEERYYAEYLLDVRPQTDARPFPNRFLKWSRLLELYKATGSRFYSLFMSGEIILAVVFFEALILSLVLLVVPASIAAKSKAKPNRRNIIYFFSVGMGFMLLELYFIKSYIHLFGDPVISLTVVLAGILVFSGIGGYVSQWVSIRMLKPMLLMLSVLLLTYLFVADRLIHGILGMPTMAQFVLALLILLPPGVLIGLPFTLGMQHLLQVPSERAYAWAVNGCASVLASIAAAQMALSIGIPLILIAAIGSYMLAYISAGN